MIQVNKIIPQVVEHFDPEKNSLGFLNYEESLDLRVQIKKEQISGYFLRFNSVNIPIDKNGTLYEYPNGLYEIAINYLFELL